MDGCTILAAQFDGPVHFFGWGRQERVLEVIQNLGFCLKQNVEWKPPETGDC